MINLEAYLYNFKLTEPIAISFHTFYYRENVLIKLKYKDLVGIGEAAPFKLITGDEQSEVIEQAKLISELDINPESDSLETLHEYLNRRGITSHTLKAAVDFAYHDLLGKLKNIPVYKLYTDRAKPVDNSLTVFVYDSLEETKNTVKNLYMRDPKISILKIKLKGEDDVERVKAIKSVSPLTMRFIVDANQGFSSADEAVKVLNDINDILGDVILVEEPCPKGDLDKLKFVKEHVKNMLVFADESAATVEDAEKVIKYNASHGINIKLEKAGGIWPSKRIAQMCNENGFKIMVGCMLEGPLALSAGTHFAASTSNVILTDLDGDIEMPSHTNLITPSINGQRIPIEKPGLGIDLDEEKIKQLNFQKEMIYQKVV